MIDYKDTKKAMEIRGVEFTDAQFSMCLMISVGVDEYDAYMASIVPNKIGRKKPFQRITWQSWLTPMDRD